jgi:carboxymethylenebutenolidase
MGDMVTLKAEDGHTLSAYRATPAGSPRGAIVVIQEIFGVNRHIRKVTDGFAGDGYEAIAPAIFDRVERGYESGYTPADIERGRAVRGKLSMDDVMKDVRATVHAAAQGGRKVGIVGYCFGGLVAWLASTRIDGLSAAVGYYGGGIADVAEEQPRCPVMLHFGETDHAIPKEHYEKVMRLHPGVPVHIYPAGHGFNCDERGSYDATSARVARERTIEFFRTHVG